MPVIPALGKQRPEEKKFKAYPRTNAAKTRGGKYGSASKVLTTPA